MNHFDTISRLYNIHRLIQQEKTGTPDEFANCFHLSRRQLYNIIEELKDYGAPIKYSRKKRTFYYDGTFNISLNTLNLSSEG
jgi:predicted DNA-binding transcriptional regulator YafY